MEGFLNSEVIEKICEILVAQEDDDLLEKLGNVAKTFQVSEDVLASLKARHVLELLNLLRGRAKDSDCASNFSLESFLEKLRRSGYETNNIINCFPPPAVWIQPSLRKHINDFIASDTHSYLVICSPGRMVTKGKVDQQLATRTEFTVELATSEFDCIRTCKASQDSKMIVSVLADHPQSILLRLLGILVPIKCKVIMVTEESLKEPPPESVKVVEDDIKWSHVSASLQQELLSRNVQVVEEGITDSLMNVIKERILVPLDFILKGEFLKNLLSGGGGDMIATWPGYHPPPQPIDCFAEYIGERVAFARSEFGIDELNLLKMFAFCGLKVEFPQWAVHFKRALWDNATPRVSYREISKIGVVSEWSSEGAPRFLEKNVPQYLVARFIVESLKGSIKLEREEHVHISRFILEEAFECDKCHQGIEHAVVTECNFKNDMLSGFVRELLSRDERVYVDELQLLSEATTSGKKHDCEKFITLALLKFDAHLLPLLSTALDAQNMPAFKYLTEQLVGLSDPSFNSWKSLFIDVAKANDASNGSHVEILKFLLRARPSPQQCAGFDSTRLLRLNPDKRIKLEVDQPSSTQNGSQIMNVQPATNHNQMPMSLIEPRLRLNPDKRLKVEVDQPSSSHPSQN